MKHLATLDTWPWINDYGSFVVLVVAPRSTKPLILASGQKQFAASLAGDLDFRLSDFVTVSGSVLLLQLIATTVATSLVAARLAIKFLAANHTGWLGVLGLQFVKTDLSTNLFLAFGQEL